MNAETDGALVFDKYNQFIQGLELTRVRVIESEIKVSSSTPEANRSIIENNYSFDYVSEDDGFEALCEFEFIFSDTEIKAELGRVRVKFGLTYTSTGLETDDSLFETVFSIFQGNTLTLNVWPFAREFLMDSMHRMDWPVFTLPLIKPAQADSHPEESIEATVEHEAVKPKRKASGRKGTGTSKTKKAD